MRGSRGLSAPASTSERRAPSIWSFETSSHRSTEALACVTREVASTTIAAPNGCVAPGMWMGSRAHSAIARSSSVAPTTLVIG